METFDYVLVGGGTSASVIAYRLGERGKSVCVLEAGPPDRNPYIHIPAGFVKTLFDPKVTWQFASEPSAHIGGRSILYSQGRTLGGSSAINGMIYNRGQAADYDGWAQRGNPGWSYQDVLPYFRRTERWRGAPDPLHRGGEGRLSVGVPPWPNPLVDAFVASAQACGHRPNRDYNGADQAGVGLYQSAIDRGRRVSAATAFLHPARRRYRVEVRTQALVTGLAFEGRRAVRVQYLRGGQAQEVAARAEIIVCAGAINSPKLLQLSGLGPPEVLGPCGVEVRNALPGVGENLHDHFSPRLVARARPGVDSVNTRVRGLRLAAEVLKWTLGRPTVLGLSPGRAYVFGKSDPALENPDYALVFLPGSYRQGRVGVLDEAPGLTCGAWRMRPESRGYVRIRSADPRESPRFEANYLATEGDRAVLVGALKAARTILRTPPVSDLVEAELLPGDEVRTDEAWLAFAREYGQTSYHLVGGCKMGPATDPFAVVDARLRVHGAQGLRVADSSIMPAIPSANTYAACLMIGEKAADLILEDSRGSEAAA